ncbi:MAG: hypothetical protein HDT38_00925 [Clostridiales bacterium]|nr:hypothetical protein [Clostridiales bacterium]
MKRKLFCTALALVLAFSLAACGGKDDGGKTPGDDQSQQSSQPAGVAAYVFRSGDATVTIDQDMAEVLAALGEPKSYFEAESCAFEGLDKTYTYSGFVITTRPDGEKDYVNSIALTDDSVTTPEGLYIGSSADDVTAAYGQSDTEADTLLGYSKGGTVLNFILDGGKVISIEYLAE